RRAAGFRRFLRRLGHRASGTLYSVAADGARRGREPRALLRRKVNGRMATEENYPSVSAMLRERRPVAPVYCIYPEIYSRTAREFVESFPGRVLYAVKANDHPDIIRLLFDAGVRHFDCASAPEIARVLST